MIIVRMQKGLGNQMFLYALIKQLEIQYPTTIIKAHISNKHSKDKESFGAYILEDIFEINVNKCTWKNACQLANYYPEDGPLSRIFFPVSRLLRAILGPKYTHIMQDDNTCFYPELYNMNPLHSYYIQGGFVNAEYLNGIEETLYRDFQFKNELCGKNLELYNEILISESVSVHIRRGDYIKLDMPVATDEYYKNAIKIINSKVKNPFFYIFSNDEDYAYRLFKGRSDFKVVTGNSGKNSYIDMQLMSACKHNIIANSTFSFWGAYLNRNTNKIVIAPNIGIGKLDNKNPIACKEWIKIDV